MPTATPATWTLHGHPPDLVLSSANQTITSEDELWAAIKHEALLPLRDHASLICFGAVWYTQHQWHQFKPTDVYTLSDGLASYGQCLNAMIPHRQEAWVLATHLRNCFDQHIGLLSPLELIARIALESKRLLLQIAQYEQCIMDQLAEHFPSFDRNWDMTAPLWIDEENGPLIFAAWRVHEDGSTLIPHDALEQVPRIEKWTVVSPWNWAPATRRYPFTAQSLWVPGAKIKRFLCEQGLFNDPDELGPLFSN